MSNFLRRIWCFFKALPRAAKLDFAKYVVAVFFGSMLWLWFCTVFPAITIGNLVIVLLGDIVWAVSIHYLLPKFFLGWHIFMPRDEARRILQDKYGTPDQNY